MLSTVKNADKVVVIKKGRVKEEGKHKDLLQKGGLYAKLVTRQLHTSFVDEDVLLFSPAPSTQTTSIQPTTFTQLTPPTHKRRGKNTETK